MGEKGNVAEGVSLVSGAAAPSAFAKVTDGTMSTVTTTVDRVVTKTQDRIAEHIVDHGVDEARDRLRERREASGDPEASKN